MNTVAATAATDMAVQPDDVHKTCAMGTAAVRALDGISISFKFNCFLVIMDPLVSRQSTMFNVPGYLDYPSRARYLIQGHDVGVPKDGALSKICLSDFVFVFHNVNLIAQLSMRENIEPPLCYLSWDAHECAKRALKLSERVSLGEGLDHRRTSELSGVQQQRVAIAVALANDPTILLADEPTGNLDSTTCKQFLELRIELNYQGKTIIIVTEDPAIATYAKAHIYMRGSRIDGDESP